MLSSEKILDRPLPSLAAWLGDGRADGFEAWVKQTVLDEQKATTADEKAMLRILRTLAIAMIETMRIESERHGRDDAETVLMLARAAGVTAIGAVISLVDTDKKPPLLTLVRLFSDEFKHGAKLMARTVRAGT